MDGHPPSFPPDERAIGPPAEGSRTPSSERPGCLMPGQSNPASTDDGDYGPHRARHLAAVPIEAIPRVPVPSEEKLDSHIGPASRWNLFPNMTVDGEVANDLLASRDRARIRVRLGAVALPVVIETLERSLEGRAPRVRQLGRHLLEVDFTVGDHSDRAWRKVADLAWSVGAVLGGGRHAVTSIQIHPIDLSAYRDRIPEQYRQPEDFLGPKP